MRAADRDAVPDAEVHLGSPAPWRDKPPAATGALYGAGAADPDPTMVDVWWVDGRDGLVFRYDDGIVFHVSGDARAVWSTWPPPFTTEDAAVYLLGPVLSYLLRRRGVLSLHASAVVVNGAAVAFCGFGGAGKSTLAAAFATAGHQVLSDDVVALRERGGTLFVYPANEYLRVWRDSADLLTGDHSRLPLLTPNWEKRAFLITDLGYAVARDPAPLAAVCILDNRQNIDAAPFVEALHPARALLALTPHTSVNYLLDERMRATEFTQLNQLVQGMPVYRVVPHTDPARLAALVALAATLAGASGD